MRWFLAQVASSAVFLYGAWLTFFQGGGAFGNAIVLVNSAGLLAMVFLISYPNRGLNALTLGEYLLIAFMVIAASLVYGIMNKGVAVEPFLDLSPSGEFAVAVGIVLVYLAYQLWREYHLWQVRNADTIARS